MEVKRIKAVSWCIILICFISMLFLGNGITVFAKTTEDAGTTAHEPIALPFSEGDLTVLAKTLYGEADSVKSQAEKAMVVWCVLNRYDNGGFGRTITGICTAPNQFSGYSSGHPVTDANLALVNDVVTRWLSEQNGEKSVGRTLAKEFCFFHSDSNPSKGEWHNKFYYYGANGKKVYDDYNNPISNPY